MGISITNVYTAKYVQNTYRFTFSIRLSRGFFHSICESQLFFLFVYNRLPLLLNIKELQKRYYIKFMSDGVYSIWREWLISEQKEPLDMIHQLLPTLQNSTLEALKKSASVLTCWLILLVTTPQSYIPYTLHKSSLCQFLLYIFPGQPLDPSILLSIKIESPNH